MFLNMFKHKKAHQSYVVKSKITYCVIWWLRQIPDAYLIDSSSIQMGVNQRQ